MSILNLARTASSMGPNDIAAGVLVYGDSGAGKTHAAAAGGKPLIVLTERNGLTTILQANPDAKVILLVGESVAKVKNANGDLVELHLSPLDVLREVIASIKRGEVQKAGYDRLIVDGLTELQRMFKDEILSRKDQGKRDMGLKDWGELADRMRRFLRTMRGLSLPVVCTALAERNQDETGQFSWQPSFEGRKTSAEVAQYFSAVGMAFKQVRTGEQPDSQVAEYRIMWDGPRHYTTKSCGVASGIQEPDVYGILQTIGATSNNDPAPGKE